MPLPTIMLQGKLTNDPTMGHMQDGSAYVTFDISCARFVYDESAKKWVAAESVVMPVLAHKRLAENINDSLRKGDEALVTGDVRQTPDGSFGVEAKAVGTSLQFRKTIHSAELKKAQPQQQQLDPDPWAS